MKYEQQYTQNDIWEKKYNIELFDNAIGHVDTYLEASFTPYNAGRNTFVFLTKENKIIVTNLLFKATEI